MITELGTPKILVCPGDRTREAAKDWASYTPAHCSYEYLAPSAPDAAAEPTHVAVRCPIHGHVGLCDGTVQGDVAKQHPERLVQRQGKLYFDPSAPPGPVVPGQRLAGVIQRDPSPGPELSTNPPPRSSSR